MKKIIGIFGTGAFILTVFMSTNTINESNVNIDLASLSTLNSANAECYIGIDGSCLMTTSGVYACFYVFFNGECDASM